jgi:hypothetical protein
MKIGKLITEASNTTADGTAKNYGLLWGDGGDNAIDRGDFDTIEVFLDKKKFQKKVISLFSSYLSDVDIEDLSYEEIQKHAEWEDFVDTIFIHDNF